MQNTQGDSKVGREAGSKRLKLILAKRVVLVNTTLFARIDFRQLSILPICQLLKHLEYNENLRGF
jgi:hypothetical protein